MKKYFLKDTNEEVTIGDIISYEDSSPFSREYTEFTLTQNILNHLKKEGVIIEKEVADFSLVKNQMKAPQGNIKIQLISTDGKVKKEFYAECIKKLVNFSRITLTKRYKLYKISMCV